MVELPWPPASLSPNARKHWRALASAKSAYLTDCYYATKAAKLDVGDKRHLRITFHPPDKRRRDLDNMLASLKAGLDGFSEAVGVDDYEWSLTITRGNTRKGGAVIVEVVD